MIELLPDIQAALTWQDYGPQPDIDGAWLKPLKKHRAPEGSFMELMRFNGGQIEDLPTTMEPRQVSISLADPHRINAFHIHPRRGQNEIWTVVAGKMTVWLIDCRRASPTAGNKRRYLLSGEEPAHLHIPAGVAHGYKAGPTGATLIYVMDQQFDAGDPDEGRLPAGLFDGESPIAW